MPQLKEMECIYRAVRTRSLHSFSLERHITLLFPLGPDIPNGTRLQHHSLSISTIEREMNYSMNLNESLDTTRMAASSFRTYERCFGGTAHNHCKLMPIGKATVLNSYKDIIKYRTSRK